MPEKTYVTQSGLIYYWMNDMPAAKQTLVFLPGLTADHRLFDQQLDVFSKDYRVLTWDAPGHAASRPFTLDFTLMDKAVWLHEILCAEGVTAPVLIGQSMGGYVSQCFMQRYPGEAKGFVSIDSAPLKRKYMTSAEIWMLKRAEVLYRLYPWKALIKDGARGCAETPYGRQNMRDMMYSYNKDAYVRLAGHGYRILADAVEADLPYRIDCPALLICGEHDKAGSTKSYNLRWAKEEQLPLHFVPNAGHNANVDNPTAVNALISAFLTQLAE